MVSSADSPGGSTTCLIATCRSSISSCASHTCPMPPAPSCRSSRYRPATTVGIVDMPMPQPSDHVATAYTTVLSTYDPCALSNEPLHVISLSCGSGVGPYTRVVGNWSFG